MPIPCSDTMFLNSLRSCFGFGSNYNEVYSMEMFNEFEYHLDDELELFHHEVFSLFKTLSKSQDDEFLSLNWLYNLLHASGACQQEFKSILINHKDEFSKPPLNKTLKDFFNRSIKSVDLCNAVCHEIKKMHFWHKSLEILSDALNSEQEVSKWQFMRARKALNDISNIMYDNSKDSRCFFSWSPSKRLQSMANSLIPPRSPGLSDVIFTMGFVHFFVLWALMVAIPSQDKCIYIDFSIPNNFLWSGPFSVIYDRIMGEFKKREFKNRVGLLKENCQMEKSVGIVLKLVGSMEEFPLTKEQRAKVEIGVNQVGLVSDAYKKWLLQFEGRVLSVSCELWSWKSEGLGILFRV